MNPIYPSQVRLSRMSPDPSLFLLHRSAALPASSTRPSPRLKQSSDAITVCRVRRFGFPYRSRKLDTIGKMLVEMIAQCRCVVGDVTIECRAVGKTVVDPVFPRLGLRDCRTHEEPGRKHIGYVSRDHVRFI